MPDGAGDVGKGVAGPSGSAGAGPHEAVTRSKGTKIKLVRIRTRLPGEVARAQDGAEVSIGRQVGR